MADHGPVTSVLTVVGFRLTDEQFTKLCNRIGCSEDELIDAMVKLGWTIGLTEDGEGNMFWPPDPVTVEVTVEAVGLALDQTLKDGGQTDVQTPD